MSKNIPINEKDNTREVLWRIARVEAEKYEGIAVDGEHFSIRAKKDELRELKTWMKETIGIKEK